MIAAVIDVKIVAPPPEPRLTPQVDFDLTDAEEWGRFAVKSTGWQMYCTFVDGQRDVVTDIGRSCEAVVTIAAPNGRVAVWYGCARTFASDDGKTHGKRQNTNRRGTDAYWAAMGCVNCSALAAFWDPRRTRGGDRDVRPLAMAAGRVLHAQAFGETPSTRDLLLAEFAVLTGADRPSTPMLLRASTTALEAACVLISIENYQGMQMLLAGKGVTA